MGIFRDYLNEARDKSVPAEFRIAIGQLKRMYNAGETPDKKELEKDAEMIAKKNKLDCDKFTEFALSQFKMNESESIEQVDESAVGAPGRTTVKDAEDHIDDELVTEFKKIIKKIGGKTVAKVLLDKLGQKPEIKDEIDHIEDIIDNSNY